MLTKRQGRERETRARSRWKRSREQRRDGINSPYVLTSQEREREREREREFGSENAISMIAPHFVLIQFICASDKRIQADVMK